MEHCGGWIVVGRGCGSGRGRRCVEDTGEEGEWGRGLFGRNDGGGRGG